MSLSAKELSYIKDFLSWELLMTKKCNHYASQEVDPNFKGIFNSIGEIHQQNYLKVLSYLQQQSHQQSQQQAPQGGMVQ